MTSLQQEQTQQPHQHIFVLIMTGDKEDPSTLASHGVYWLDADIEKDSATLSINEKIYTIDAYQIFKNDPNFLLHDEMTAFWFVTPEFVKTWCPHGKEDYTEAKMTELFPDLDKSKECEGEWRTGTLMTRHYGDD